MSIKTIHIPAGGGFEHVTVGSTQPVEPGPGEITVRVRASSLNFHDRAAAGEAGGRAGDRDFVE
ncbi:hypothetical protein WCE37_13485 [Luteimonas sp. MJ250]|uniref:hypothetical protein n=1 Tax=Luteimonas sp. MJ250 TaxID=3129236 RepID=UPI0031B9F159